MKEKIMLLNFYNYKFNSINNCFKDKNETIDQAVSEKLLHISPDEFHPPDRDELQ